MILKKIILFCLCILSPLVYSQSFNVQELKKSKLVNVTGGVSANSVFYSGTAARDPFAYFLNGNINFNIANLYNLPFSFSYSNQKFGYNKPVLMNRLSIHPSYKWVTMHIGDVSMTFSPYTLSGHQFSGVGVDLTPNSKFKISAMYGRLLKSSEFDINNPTLVPVYKRMGYGFKTGYSFDNVSFGLTFFKAKDQVNSLQNPFPFQLGVTPKENLALAFDTSFSLLKSLHINAEYSNSTITDDTNAPEDTKTNGITRLFIKSNATTKSYKALKTQLNYQVKNGTLGLGYERVAPNYKSLGGYYFNNDLENITINANQNLYKNKVSLALSIGLQRDDLDNQKKSTSKRTVSSLNIGFKASERLNIDGNYSNFQSFTNSKNQFDYINQVSQYDNLDTLNYRQVSQNAGVNLSYLIKNSKSIRKAVNMSVSMQDVVNKQDNLTVAGGATTFYNSAVSYTVSYPEKGFSILSALNGTFNKADTGNSKIFGPTLGLNKLFLNKKMTTSFSSSYNASYTNNIKQNSIVNLRLNCGYIAFEKHNLALSCLSLFGKSATNTNRDLTGTFTYTYSFDKIRLRPKTTKKAAGTENKAVVEKFEETIKLNVGKRQIEGNKETIMTQLKELQTSLKPLRASDSLAVNNSMEAIVAAKSDKEFKDKAIDFIEIFEEQEERIIVYRAYLKEAFLDLYQQMKLTDAKIEQRYSNEASKVSNHKLYGKDEENIKQDPEYADYSVLVEKSEKSKIMLVNHRWILSQLATIMENKEVHFHKNKFMMQFMNQEVEKVFGDIINKQDSDKIKKYLAQKLIPFYYNLAKTGSVNDPIILKYTR